MFKTVYYFIIDSTYPRRALRSLSSIYNRWFILNELTYLNLFLLFILILKYILYNRYLQFRCDFIKKKKLLYTDIKKATG